MNDFYQVGAAKVQGDQTSRMLDGSRLGLGRLGRRGLLLLFYEPVWLAINSASS